jgi:hypothetical protein
MPDIDDGAAPEPREPMIGWPSREALGLPPALDLTSPAAPVRVAASHSVCGASGCARPVERGQLITKPPGRPWQHLKCDHPHAGRGQAPGGAQRE